MMTRRLPIIITSLCMALASGLHAKSKLGEYYLGFSYFSGDGTGLEIDSLDFELANPVSDNNDVRLGLSWMNVDRTTGTDETSWWLTADYVYHYDGYMDSGGMFRPYISGGVGYMNDSANVILGKNGLNWKLAVGSEFLFTDAFLIVSTTLLEGERAGRVGRFEGLGLRGFCDDAVVARLAGG